MITNDVQTENLFHSYSSLVSPSVTIKPSDDELRLEQQIQDVLRRVRPIRISILSSTDPSAMPDLLLNVVDYVLMLTPLP